MPPTTRNLGESGTRTERPEQPVRTFRMNRRERIGNWVTGLLARAGVGPMWLLTTSGRRTGLPRTTPVVPVEEDGKWWLVAPYGAVSWVHNARAAGRVSLRRGRTTRHVRLREVGADEAAPVLKRYLAVATAARPYFRATKDSPVGDFVAEAEGRPVFELTPVDDGSR